MSEITFGYIYDFRNPPRWQQPWIDYYAEVIDLIAWSEEIGFTNAWIPEHHLADDGYMPSPLVMMTAIAARTKTLKIGGGIALAPFYHPVRFAEDCAVLDIISGGRVEMGLGIGYRQREMDAYGIDKTTRGKLFDEWLEIVTRLWAGETVDFKGRFFDIKGAKVMPPAPRGHIPLYIGGLTEKAIERTARYGDGYFGDDGVIDIYAQKMAERGRDLSTGRVRIIGMMVQIAEDVEDAFEELAPYYHYINNNYAEWFTEGSVGRENGIATMTLDEFKASGLLQVWTPDQAIDKLRAYQKVTPIDHYTMMMPPGLPPSRFREYMKLVSEKVMPAFRKEAVGAA
jgi:alkanesulfonate monooxygenase SsuD/methylene tetrahydromethanopterin reductase-like flavin-dependent oxidoreductase (luciferase family)